MENEKKKYCRISRVTLKKYEKLDFPGGPLHSKAGDSSSVPSLGSKIPQATVQLGNCWSLSAPEPADCN